MSRLTLRPHIAGFSLIEAMVALGIMSIVLSVGVPKMNEWLNTNRAAAALEFYAEGFRQAQEQALLHNSASRLIMIDSADGKVGWRVDVCYATPAVPCSNDSGEWSTPENVAENDPAGADGFRSILRPGDGLPSTEAVRVSMEPAGADQLYFTPLGWVNQRVNPRLTGVNVSAMRAGEFATTALKVSLAGIASKCQPNLAAGDSRSCYYNTN